MQHISDPLTIVLIGTTGDLAKKKILKSLYWLHEQGLFPQDQTGKLAVRIIGNARRALSDQEYQQFVKSVIGPVDGEKWQEFSAALSYVAGSVDQPQTTENIITRYKQFCAVDGCHNLLWYVATLPKLYESLVKNLAVQKFEKHVTGWNRLVIEKPFGTDLESAQQLNQQIAQVFPEECVFRVDHFLAKETVQNILAFRFGNGIFEHLWSNQYIKSIQVSALESLGVEGRESFYDQTGALRDVVQNHVLQMLAVTLMGEPDDLSADGIRDRRQQVLSSLSLADSALESVKLGQFSSGEIEGARVVGYLDHDQIPNDSETETAAALWLQSDLPKWQGVPILLRAGKRMQRSVTEVNIEFKEPPNDLFGDISQKPNILTLRVSPNEGIVLRLHVKKPGLQLELSEETMQFCYRSSFSQDLIEAYVKVIHDAILGQPTLFPRADGIEASWQVMAPVLNAHLPLEQYSAGSWGPASWKELASQANTQWIEPSVEVCAL